MSATCPRRPRRRVLARRQGSGRHPRVSLAQRKTGKLGARLDAELAEHVAEGGIDRARGEEELRGNLLVGEPLGDEARDLNLLRRELVDSARVTLARGLARGAKLGASPVRPRLGTEALEALQAGSGWARESVRR